jgi:hypothetical protein
MHGVGTSQARDCGSCRARKRRTQVLAMGSCVCVCARTSACARSLRALTRHYTPPHTHLQPPRTGAVIACRLLMCLIVLDVCSHRLRPIRRQLFDVVCTQGISDVSGDVRRRRPDATGDVRGTGPRDRAHARAPACQRGSCPTRDYATPRRCDLKPRSFESRAQYERIQTLLGRVEHEMRNTV